MTDTAMKKIDWDDVLCGLCVIVPVAVLIALFVVMVRFLWIGGSAIAASSYPCQ